MATAKLVDEEVSIVLTGSFNPAIFHPEWLVRHELIPSIEGDNVSDVKLIHNDLASFSLNWLNFEVTSQRFQLKCKDTSKYEPMRDLAISIFSILGESPIKQMGINCKRQYEFSSKDLWQKFGDTLAPKAIWHKSLSEKVGLLRMTVKSPRKDDLQGCINVTVAGISENVIQFDINNHIELGENGVELLTKVLSESWNDSLTDAENIAITTLGCVG